MLPRFLFHDLCCASFGAGGDSSRPASSVGDSGTLPREFEVALDLCTSGTRWISGDSPLTSRVLRHLVLPATLVLQVAGFAPALRVGHPAFPTGAGASPSSTNRSETTVAASHRSA